MRYFSLIVFFIVFLVAAFCIATVKGEEGSFKTHELYKVGWKKFRHNYIIGLSDGSGTLSALISVDKSSSHELKQLAEVMLCPGDHGWTKGQIVKVFDKFVEENPNKLHLHPIRVLLLALNEQCMDVPVDLVAK